MAGAAGFLGATLEVDHGSWTPTPVLYSEQWEDCDSAGANCAPVAGQTSTSYTLSDADVGHTIRVVEQAAVPGGQLGPSVASPAVTGPASAGGPPPSYPTVPPEFPAPPAPAVPAPTATTPTPPPTTRTAASALSAAEVRAALSALLSVPGSKKALAGALKHGYSLSFDAPGSGRLRVDWYYTPPTTAKSRKRQKPELIASAKRTISAAGTLLVKVTLTSRGKALLRANGSLKVSVVVSFTPHGRTRTTMTATRRL